MSWIEFHDSTVLSAIQTGAKVEIGLNAYVHRWQKRRDGWCGTGWSQPIRVLIKNVINCTVKFEGPVGISDGCLKIGAVEHDNGIELPYTSAEPAVLRLALVDANDIEIAGRGILVEAAGAARYIEDLPPDLRPKDIG
jgi:hypothetical protein